LSEEGGWHDAEKGWAVLLLLGFGACTEATVHHKTQPPTPVIKSPLYANSEFNDE
jgi:hypothetical protein